MKDAEHTDKKDEPMSKISEATPSGSNQKLEKKKKSDKKEKKKQKKKSRANAKLDIEKDIDDQGTVLSF